MENVIAVFLIVCSMCILAVVANVVAWWQTETRFRLPLNFKPFTSRPHFSFWLVFLFNLPVCFEAAKTHDHDYVLCLMMVIAFLMGLVSYLYNKSKVKTNE